MSTLLVKNASVLVTMDASRREISSGGLFIRDGWIEQAGDSKSLPAQADEVIELSGHLVIPGMINTHHHLFQTLDRACPACQSTTMAGWLKALYPRWEKMTPDDVKLATEIGLGELALSGCTTVADHHYLWPNGNRAEDQVEVADRSGLRFHLGRGFQTLGVDDGGFAPRSLTEKGDAALRDCERVVNAFHDASAGSMRQVFIAPSSLRTVSPEFLRESANLARALKVGFHMHLGETLAELDFVRQKFHCRPAELAEQFGCVGENTWYAHGVHLDDADTQILRRNGCGICHCPSSNMVLVSGIAPIQRYRKAGLTVGLGVDGAASNDSSNIMAELRQAFLLSRLSTTAPDAAMTARDALEIATIGGARLLGRKDIGRLEPGCVADFAAIRIDRLPIIGADDPVAALASCVIGTVDHSWVHGRRIVREGALLNCDTAALAARFNARRTRLH